MLHVGLTGNIASGKSVAAVRFTELGAHVIDADLVVHELLKSGTATYRKIMDAFGREILTAKGEIDRRKLGQMVFCDANKRLLLNSLTHPEVGAEILRRMSSLEEASPNGIIIVDAALMVETGSYKMYQYLIVVLCNPDVQVSRLMSRDGLTEADAKARVASQLAIEEKLKLADYVIDTSGTLRHTYDQVDAIYGDLQLRENNPKH
jgi:dephospho-CoA kinase